MPFKGRDLTDVHSFTKDELIFILDKATQIKNAIKNRDVASYKLAGDGDLIAALLFYENSTRTRTSFEIAAMRLGMHTTGFASTEGTSVKKGESLKHTLDMYEAYDCDAIIMRHPLDGSARFAADHLGVPVFNAGDGKHEHPTQTLLDLFTIREHLGRLDNFEMGVAGDLKYGRTAHSLVVALAMFNNVRIHLFSHPDLSLPNAFMQDIKEKGVEVVLYDDLAAMTPEVDIMYQTRIQKERMPDLSEFERAKDKSQFTMSMLKTSRDGFGLMHPLPIDKAAPSISSEIDSHRKAIYKVQAGNGVPTRLTELALSLGLLGNDFEGETWQPHAADDGYIESLPVVIKPLRTDVSILPIRKNGVVVDHLLPYSEERLIRVLKVRERRNVYRGGTVRSLSRPEVIKGMLMIEDREFSDDELRAIAAVSPGCRVNTIREGKVEQKVRLRLPYEISGIRQISCTNKNCITHTVHQESVDPKMIRTSSDRVRCAYCDQMMQSAEMFK
jgi:aspartate carbamoyltransferase catalytic subunit